MKRHVFASLVLLSLAAALVAQEHQMPAPAKHPLLDRLKPLAGRWETTVGGRKMTTNYSVVANGSAIMENLMPEGENMVDMIHADGDALMLTHYCGGASQPRYRATKFDGESIDFRFLDGTNLGDSYMAGVKLTLVDADHLKQEWTNVEGGKSSTMVLEFTRVK